MAQSLGRMSLQDAIDGRCSVRAYAPENIDRPTLDELMAAAVRAPTAMHAEPWQFVIVQDTARLKRLSERAKAALATDARLHPDRRHADIFAQPQFNVFYDAPTLIVICASAPGPFAAADCWLAAQNLMLCAHALGLGTCVIGSAVAALNLPDVKQELGIPVESLAVAPIIVGKPRGETAAGARKAPHVLAWR
jgi:nitroreductase